MYKPHSGTQRVRYCKLRQASLQIVLYQHVLSIANVEHVVQREGAHALLTAEVCAMQTRTGLSADSVPQLHATCPLQSSTRDQSANASGVKTLHAVRYQGQLHVKT